MSLKLTLAKALRGPAWRVLYGQVEAAPMKYAPGHYYSPLPSIRDIQEQAHFEITALDLRRDDQIALLDELDLVEPTGPRYHAPNDFFPPNDAAIYEAITRHYQPAQVIEVGSGWSTAALFDAGAAPQVTLIEPYPDRLRELLSDADLARCELITSRLQDVPIETFKALQAGDVLFVDSTHVTKLGSDVNRIFFEVLPALASGVLIHFHDVFYPFEYLEEWVREGWGWNEAYLLRAFLEYNSAFKILLWADMLKQMGHLTGNTGSIWLQKT